MVSTLPALDDIDRDLIALLRDHARMPVAAIAKKLKIARGTVQNRMARLERDGVIVGYTVRLRPNVERHRIRAIMSIEVAGHHGEAVGRALRGNPNVVALHSTNGRWDFVAEVRADHLESFDVVLNAIRSIEGISNTETGILLSTYKL
jgi:DNA-binding Lrp family transcriptional regulator